ncbi:hypothetical protein [Rhodopirellula sp. MGV]|uniref:hypothetical protein n=1 Tax=Rhodopirellula sp. MGV TaxID=2023130 RepID=UPI000B96F397|nr:hypothetical protein [Rhodopirellula sp. MGV]OYP33795.1 hypothetical protein CGZ80_17775 [Rhodopirellula sp. MGV]PNY37541.1 hypothetical protein C2E31_07370 [Rhodopirellula baltica]
MAIWIDRFLIACLILVVAVLTVTSVPALGGQTLGGSMLLTHMMASGMLVFGLPLFAFVMVRYLSPRHSTSWLYVLGYLLIVVAGLGTIASVFYCMLPIPSTDQMHELMQVHKWAGLAMTPAIVLFLIGMRLTRSASRPHS